MTAPGRWTRLDADLRAAGADSQLTARTYPGGTSHSITARRAGGALIEVHDKWWSKNADIWIGWQVHAEDRDGITVRTWPITKKRAEVVAAVADALRNFPPQQHPQAGPQARS